MSEMIQCEVPIKDQDVLVDSLVELGIPRENIELFPSDKPGTVNGWGTRTRKAHVIIRKGHAGSRYADIGFEMTPDGCKIHIDHSDVYGGVTKRIGQPEIGGTGELAKIYAKNSIVKLVKRSGRCHVSSISNEGDKIRVRVSMS